MKIASRIPHPASRFPLIIAMKTLNVINPLRNTLKHLALASAMGATNRSGA